MKRFIPKLLSSLVLLPLAVRGADSTTVLWFDKPATTFHQSMPLGNGRIGAMVFGGVNEERIVLNQNFRLVRLARGGRPSPCARGSARNPPSVA
jgi:hypothetical protein